MVTQGYIYYFKGIDMYFFYIYMQINILNNSVYIVENEILYKI